MCHGPWSRPAEWTEEAGYLFFSSIGECVLFLKRAWWITSFGKRVALFIKLPFIVMTYRIGLLIHFPIDGCHPKDERSNRESEPQSVLWLSFSILILIHWTKKRERENNENREKKKNKNTFSPLVPYPPPPFLSFFFLLLFILNVALKILKLFFYFGLLTFSFFFFSLSFSLLYTTAWIEYDGSQSIQSVIKNVW